MVLFSCVQRRELLQRRHSQDLRRRRICWNLWLRRDRRRLRASRPVSDAVLRQQLWKVVAPRWLVDRGAWARDLRQFPIHFLDGDVLEGVLEG